MSLFVTESCLKNAMQLSGCDPGNNLCGCYTVKFRRIGGLLLGRDASHSCDGVRHMDLHSDKKKSACIIASAVLIDLRCDVFSCSNKIDLLFHKRFQFQVKNVMRGEDKLSQMTFLLSFWRCMRKAFAGIITDIIRLFIELVVQYQQFKRATHMFRAISDSWLMTCRSCLRSGSRSGRQPSRR